MNARMLLLPALLIAATPVFAQECAAGSARAALEALDTTGAALRNAMVNIDNMAAGHTDDRGAYRSSCLTSGTHLIRIEAEGFAAAEGRVEAGRSLTLRLRPSTVETVVEAAQDDPISTESVAGTKTLEGREVQQLADDPDEFERQLQVLAAAAGGAPGQAIIAVDGFQNGGKIPPKSAIAFIRVNPDLFSAEYERPPYQGGRVEIFTKPGQAKIHGALFTTQSAEFLNARDPFSPTSEAIGKQRYGFEFGGPIRKDRSDYFLALEHREIDQFAVVNAVTLDANANPTQTISSVPTPQSLWEGSARLGLLLNPKNNVTATYTANVNGLTNVGVGGTALREAGYSSSQAEHVLRVTDLSTLSATAVHEARLGLTYRTRIDAPNSTAAALQVAGAFLGGGNTTQRLRSHELDIEVDDDLLLQRHKHSIKIGLEALNARITDRLPSNFNGTYIFGGGPAPVLDGNGNATAATTTITGLEQYRRTLLHEAGGTATELALTSGNPSIGIDQLRVVLYAQDVWKLRPRLELSGGIRYALQNAPVTFGNIAPRLGVAWSPDRKQRWVIHARTGLFFSPIDTSTVIEALRLNGKNQAQLQVTSPAAFAPAGALSTAGAALVTTLRSPLPELSQIPSIQTHFGVEHDFPRHWHAQVNFYLARAWNDLRSRDINAPVNDQPAGPRPIAPALNLYQYQQTGGLGGNVIFAGVDQHSLKHLQIFAGYIRMNLKTNADNASLFPQSSYSDAGEYARPTWEATHHFIAFTNYVFPLGIVLSNQFDAASGNPYNVTTGFDNNGDGVFNDRPRVANAGDANANPTAFGPLTSTGSGAVLGRNAGTLPWNVHLDGNLSRTFKLPGREGQSVALNLRSTNLLNHLNGTAVGGVLGSPLFGRTYAADPGRRMEVGLRYSF